jgi:hypothetical protein
MLRTGRTHAAISSPRASLRIGSVIPAQAGIQYGDTSWIPACAGMTAGCVPKRSEAGWCCWCSLVLFSPSDELSSAGLCGARDSAHQHLTSGGCLNAASEARVVSSARPAKIEQRKAALAQRGPSRQGRFFAYFLVDPRKLVACRGELPAPTSKPGRTNHAKRAQGFDASARAVGGQRRKAT